MTPPYLLLALIAPAVAALRHLQVFSVAAPHSARWLTGYRYAHRGLHNKETPENSVSAFKKAVAAGYAVEMDLRLTKDGEVVVFHDSDLKRMTGVRGCVMKYTLAELKELRLKGTEERIPTLEEALGAIGGRVPILFELKSMGLSGKLERRFYGKVEQYHGAYAVQSFSPFSLCWFRLHAPHVARGQLACDFKATLREMNMPALKRHLLNVFLQAVKRLETNFICRPNFISYEAGKVHIKLLEKLRKRGAPVLAWTVRDEEQYKRALPYTDAVIFEDFLPSP